MAAGCLLGCSSSQRIEGFPEEYVGIGLELGKEGEELTIVRVIAGGPSAVAGIEAGDRVVAINGESTAGMNLGDAVARLRGPPDSQLTLGLDRQGERMLVVLKRQRLVRVGEAYERANGVEKAGTRETPAAADDATHPSDDPPPPQPSPPKRRKRGPRHSPKDKGGAKR